MIPSEYRENIDKIDAEIVRLFSERMATAAKIAEYKKKNGLPVLDAARERAKIASVIENTPEDLREYSPLLYSLILDLSKSYQGRIIGSDDALSKRIEEAVGKTPKLFPDFASVACQGIEGANSQLAADKLFKNANVMFFSSFGAVFTAIEKGLCRYGVIPVENSTAGSVNSVYDLMMGHEFNIVRSIRLKVDHDLLAPRGTKLSDVREVYSHEQAINQCSKFLEGLSGVKVVLCENTAVAAKTVAESGRRDVAAIASSKCADYYGLDRLARSVQNNGSNYTRFICISKELEIYPGASRTSLMLRLPHEPGSLYKLLSRFYALGVNVCKLESRPIPNSDFEFMFYFDLDAPVYSEGFRRLICELPGACDGFSYLGSYNEVI